MSGTRAREVRQENARLVAWIRSMYEDAGNRILAVRFARAFRKAKQTIGRQFRIKGGGGVLKMARTLSTPTRPEGQERDQ